MLFTVAVTQAVVYYAEEVEAENADKACVEVRHLISASSIDAVCRRNEVVSEEFSADVDDEEIADLARLCNAADVAAEGDGNDAEIGALREALEAALCVITAAGYNIPQPDLG